MNRKDSLSYDGIVHFSVHMYGGKTTMVTSTPNCLPIPQNTTLFSSLALNRTVNFSGAYIMKMKTVEIPDFYLHDVAEKGVDFMDEYYNVIPGAADRYIYATNIVNSKSGDDLIQFIAEILLAYDALKYRDRG